MTYLFQIVNSDKTVQLQVLSEQGKGNVDAKCTCNQVVKIKDYFGMCMNCKTQYMGPLLVL